MKISFNKPYLSGNEIKYIKRAIQLGKISGDGYFTKKCQLFFEKKYGFKKVLLTTSCTDALEMAAILIDIKKGDEIIAPSFGFVSTVNAFVLRDANIVFADSSPISPSIDDTKIESLITNKTKAIVVIHYAGVACQMDAISKIAQKHRLFLIEDVAHAIDSYYRNQPLGSLGHLSAFSFHETKNIISGEGGMIVINDKRFIKRAEIIREKGTNRAAFFRGEVEKYRWIDIGSSYLPSDITAAFLYGQIKNLRKIQSKRKKIWKRYYQKLQKLEKSGFIKLPVIPKFASNNAHMFYILCKNLKTRTKLLSYLNKRGIHAVFHYLPLHKSKFYKNKHDGRKLPMSVYYSNCLIRLPFFYELTNKQIDYIVNSIINFFND